MSQPVFASSVPCAPAAAIRQADDLFISYSDRSHALRAQDLSHGCSSGVPPPGLPHWPEAVMPYPGSGRMDGALIGAAANTAAIAAARRSLATVGQVLPSRITFGSTQRGNLTLTSIPEIPPGTNATDVDGTRVRVANWTEMAGTGVSALPHGRVPRDEIPGVWPEAMGGAAVAVPQSTMNHIGDTARTHINQLASAVPGIVYDMSHYSNIREQQDSRYSVLEFVFGRGSRGLYLSIILALAAIVASSARCIT